MDRQVSEHARPDLSRYAGKRDEKAYEDGCKGNLSDTVCYLG